MAEFVLVRHGETDWNRELRFQGQLDVPLNAVGQEQARRVAARLADESVDAIVSSDLLRAVQTADAMLQRLAHGSLTRDPGLREQHFGRVEGMSAPEIKLRYPEAWAQWIRFDERYTFDGGECLRDFHDRVVRALQSLGQIHKGRRVAVVTHGGALDMIFRSAQGLSLSGPRSCEIPNGGISRVQLDPVGGGLKVLSWADVSHLEGLGPQPVYDQQKLSRENASA